MYYQQKILALAKMLKNSNLTYALTGAGISTESGIPDFRSPEQAFGQARSHSGCLFPPSSGTRLPFTKYLSNGLVLPKPSPTLPLRAGRLERTAFWQV